MKGKGLVLGIVILIFTIAFFLFTITRVNALDCVIGTEKNFRCENNFSYYERCNNYGWANMLEACASYGGSCVSGKCVYPNQECEMGTKRNFICSGNTLSYDKCVEGKWVSNLYHDDCSLSNMYCQNGACVSTPTCTEGDQKNFYCAGTQLRRDRCVNGVWTDAFEDCAWNNKICQNNQCITNITAPTCTPNCVGKSCGDDGCGGSCGTCSSDMKCQEGVCILKSTLCANEVGYYGNNYCFNINVGYGNIYRKYKNADCSISEILIEFCDRPCENTNGEAKCIELIDCSDNKIGGYETDIDCGGKNCNPCSSGKKCSANLDCQSSVCINGICIEKSLNETTGGITRNNTECSEKDIRYYSCPSKNMDVVWCSCIQEKWTCSNAPETQCVGECSEGCLNQKICYPVKTRAEINGTNVYCDVTKTFEWQKEKYTKCNDNYECKSNLCLEGECQPVKEMIQQASGLTVILSKIMCRLASFLAIEKYDNCMFQYAGVNVSLESSNP